MLHGWYLLLDRLFIRMYHCVIIFNNITLFSPIFTLSGASGSVWSIAARKVAVEQVTWAPVILTAFFTSQELLKGHGVEGVTLRLRNVRTFVFGREYSAFSCFRYLSIICVYVAYSEGLCTMQDLWNGLLANWQVWPAAQLFNFRFVPPRDRVLFICIVSLGWVRLYHYYCQLVQEILLAQLFDGVELLLCRWNVYLSILQARKITVDQPHEVIS